MLPYAYASIETKELQIVMEENKYYEKLDQPEVLQILFHPRKETNTSPPPGAIDHDIKVAEDVLVGARFYLADSSAPNILFFHGNGEIACDYDSIGPLYNEFDLSFLAVDYRGYGRSNGKPTVTSMMRDAHIIFKEIRNWLQREDRSGALLVMGRSLGSACAMELAAAYHDDIAGLIIESGFSTTLPFLQNLGVDTHLLGITEGHGFGNVQKIERFSKPTLILHAQHDQLIHPASAEILQAQCGARSKEFQIVPDADHNTILKKTGRLYFEVIKRFVNKISGKAGKRSRRYRR